MQYSLRSNALSSISRRSRTSADGRIKTCAIKGMLWRDFSPKTSGCTGTLRQAIIPWPFASTMRSKWRWTFSLSTTSGGRKIKPTAYFPASGSSTSCLAHSFTKKLCGICSSTPAPSPEFISAPWPPRWSMLCRTTRACLKILLDFLPLILATTPTPQASCSNQGSYNPCFLGSEVFIINSPLKAFYQ